MDAQCSCIWRTVNSSVKRTTRRSFVSHTHALTYYHPCFDFSESIRANPCNVINIHEPSSSFSLSAFYIVISGIIRSSFVIL